VITARSWRSHRYAGDIDLIGWEGGCLCFIEVKTRTTRDVASAESAVDEDKRKTLRKMARHYSASSRSGGGAIRCALHLL
jgi:putative endonuclease